MQRRVFIAALFCALTFTLPARAATPFTQQAQLTGTAGIASETLGGTVAVSGDTIVVGAPGRTVAGQPAPAAYVFVRPASGWADAHETAVLTPSMGSEPSFGASVAIDGDTIVVGGPDHPTNMRDSAGAAFVFVKPATGWVDAHQSAVLTATDENAHDGFGSAVAVSGDTVVVGPAQHDVGTHMRQGEAWVFVKPSSGWADEQQNAKLVASDGGENDFLGQSVSISGDTVVAGAHGWNGSRGAAYVFVKPAGGWADTGPSAKLTATDGAPNDLLGASVAIDGGTVVAGALSHKVGQSVQGAAYVFVKPIRAWNDLTQTAELTASDASTNDKFGASVALSGNRVVVGSLLHQVGANAGQGAAYVFDKPGAVWRDSTESAQLTAADGATGDVLGLSVAVAGNLTLAHAPFHAAGAGKGTVYVFGVPPVINVAAPADGATFERAASVPAAYTCEAPAGSTITSCAGSVASGQRIDTSTLGQHTFTVDSVTSDGVRARKTVTYNVVSAGSPPSITGLSQSANRWREHGKKPLGTTFSFRLDQPARVTLRFTRGGAAKFVGALSIAGRAGVNVVHFRGRLPGKKTLALGRYRMRATAVNARGQSTTSRALSFSIVRR